MSANSRESLPPAEPGKPLWRRLLPLGLLVLLAAIAFAFDLHHYLSLETLKTHQQALERAVEARPLVTGAGFVLVYAAVVAISLPGAALMTIAGGYLFGVWLGGLLVITGATSGAVVVFLVARTSLGEPLAAKAGPWLERMRHGFNEDGVSYLFVLRLIPVFPFWIVNIVPALLGMRLGPYTLATFLGIMPGSFVYASVGNGLGAVIAAGDEPDLGIILDPAVLGPLLGLAALALLPVGYKRWRRRRPV